MQAVIFDRDGVIIDSERVHMDEARDAFLDQGIELSQDELRSVVARHPTDYLAEFAARHAFDAERLNRVMNRLYHERIVEAPLIPGIVELVRAVRDAGAAVALTTSAERDTTDAILDRHGLADLFDVVVTFEDYERRKPDPQPYLFTATRLGLDPSACVVIEDSSVGVRSAVAAGMRCIAVPTDYPKDDDFSGAYRIVSSATELDARELVRD